MKKLCEINTKSLHETKKVLDDVRITCGNLEEKLIEKDEYYGKREKELQEFNETEFNKGNKIIKFIFEIYSLK